MTQNKQKTTTKKATAKVAKTSARKAVQKNTCDCTSEQKQLQQTKDRIALMSTSQDLRNAVLIVSLVINLYFLIAWVLLQVTTRYDATVAELLFNR